MMLLYSVHVTGMPSTTQLPPPLSVQVGSYPLGSLRFTGSSPALAISDACRSRREGQEALWRALMWWGGQRSRGCKRARAANACFRGPRASGVVVPAGAAVIATSIPRRRLCVRDLGRRCPEVAWERLGG